MHTNLDVCVPNVITREESSIYPSSKRRIECQLTYCRLPKLLLYPRELKFDTLLKEIISLALPSCRVFQKWNFELGKVVTMGYHLT